MYGRVLIQLMQLYVQISYNTTFPSKVSASSLDGMLMYPVASSILGTFLVRSGILTSVHSFALDPERGIFILLIFSYFILGSLII